MRRDDPRLHLQREALKAALQLPAVAGPAYDELPEQVFTHPALASVHRAVRVAGKTLVEVCGLPIGDLAEWFAVSGALEAGLEPLQRTIAAELLKEIRGRLDLLLGKYFPAQKGKKRRG